MNDRLISGLFHFFRLDLKNCPVRSKQGSNLLPLD
jgi:hypothetical protein